MITASPRLGTIQLQVRDPRKVYHGRKYSLRDRITQSRHVYGDAIQTGDINPATKKGSAIGALFSNKTVSIIVMDDGLLAISVTVFLLDHRCPIRRLALFDHGAVAISITIVALANSRSSTDWSNANANVISEGGGSDCADHRRSEQVLFHVSLSSRYHARQSLVLPVVPEGRGKRCICSPQTLELGPLPSARPRPLEEGEALTVDGR
jgi:hypothetical protein